MGASVGKSSRNDDDGHRRDQSGLSKLDSPISRCEVAADESQGARLCRRWAALADSPPEREVRPDCHECDVSLACALLDIVVRGILQTGETASSPRRRLLFQ